jgi:hypothetical protein
MRNTVPQKPVRGEGECTRSLKQGRDGACQNSMTVTAPCKGIGAGGSFQVEELRKTFWKYE